MKFPEGGQRVEQTQQIVDYMHAVGLHVDIGNVVFGPGSSDLRDNYYCAVRMVGTVGDGAQYSVKRVAEAFPHALTLSFRLDGLGGFNFSGTPQANLTRLPWGGSGSEVVAFVRGPLLANHIYNEKRLAHFHERVLAPTVLQIVGTMIEAERAHFVTSSALAADEKQTADVRNANLAKTARAQAKLGTLEALQAQPTHDPSWGRNSDLGLQVDQHGVGVPLPAQ